ncbi:MAG: DUF87 domain-containing protein [Lachnospiraceae bacterium]|nr:DUF87 domain-containing protein [Lachnospiraceae bacterium]
MRLIPGKTKVKIELFRGVTLGDVVIGLLGLIAVTLCAISSLPARWVIAGIIAVVFGILIVRFDDEAMYVFFWHMIRYRAYPRRYSRIYDDKALLQMSNKNLPQEFFDSPEEMAAKEDKEEEELSPAEKKKRLKALIKEEDKILKSKTATKEEKDAVWLARANRSAEKKKEKKAEASENGDFEDMADIMPFTNIKGGFIEYGDKYYGTVIEIDPVEFRFFSRHRRNNAIEACFGKVLRSLQGEYGANIVKLQRPIVYDEYLDAEYEKLNALKRSYESGMLSEEELQSRVEIQYDRINEVRSLCNDERVIESFYYLALFESDKGRLDILTRQAVMNLEQGELTVRRLFDRDLAVFLKYSNSLDFDEKEIDNIAPENWASWAMPQDLKITMRKIEVNNIITHNLRVISYPSTVGDSWMAGVMSFPATKVVVKLTPMDNTKSVRAIDRSLAELRGQYMNTSIDSKMIELQEHIETLSSLLVTLKQDNESLLSANIYVTAYDVVKTAEDPYLAEKLDSEIPSVADMKKTLKRSYSEAGMRMSGMDFMQIQAFIGSQVSNYDPLVRDARGIPTNTVAGMYPWIFAHISDKGGIKLGSADGVPVFIDFFRRDSERVNSNMVIVGKSGSGKSYATKSLLSNLASEDAKIFILDPENEYSELAHNLHGKVINVGNAKYGRLNPFHIITALDDDEAGVEGGGPGGSFATHLQFLEEFFRQILPDIDKDALEYLNSLIERVYLNFGITPETDLSTFTAEDYPIFDDLYDVVLAEFERTNNEYLRQLLRSLVNYIAKFSTGGRNANIWNGPSTITTDENFSVFNFQSMLANRNTTIANAQMLLVLKYIDNEIIKNRDYNTRYGLKRKVVVVIDEAHVFIDTKFPVALDFMFQLAKRIRKYNGMQIVITQNIKDFVGSEEIARKSSAIINACQYSFVFGLAPNDMDDLCKLYAKAGGINEQEQEDILGAKRGQAFTIMSPTSRSSFQIEVPSSMVEMFENMDFESNYFSGEDGEEVWEEFVAESRESHDANLLDRMQSENSVSEAVEETSSLTFSEISEEEAEQLMSEESVDTEASGRGQRKSAMEKLMEAEEVVDRREYEMAVGRFGGISFSETAGEEYDSEQASVGSESFGGISFSETTGEEYDNYEALQNEGYVGISFSEITGEEYDNEQLAGEDESYDESYDEGYGESFGGISFSETTDEEYDSEPVAASHHGYISNSRDVSKGADTLHRHIDNIQLAGVRTDALAQNDYAYSKAYIEEELNKFKASVREEMERELEERLKWISLGAGIGATGLAGVAGMGTGGTLGTADEGAVSADMMTAGGEMPVAREGFKQASSEEGYEKDKGYKTEEGYASEKDYDTEEGYGSEEYRPEEGYGSEEDYEPEVSLHSEGSYGDEGEFSFDEDYETSEEYGSEEEYDSEEGYDEDSEYDEDESDVEFEDDESEDDEFELPEDEFFFDDDEDSEYEPAPFVFADLLDSMAEEYADMNLDERMEELGEPVMEITLEELAAYVKEKRKK